MSLAATCHKLSSMQPHYLVSGEQQGVERIGGVQRGQGEDSYLPTAHVSFRAQEQPTAEVDSSSGKQHATQ
jgi:hypothetical protein